MGNRQRPKKIHPDKKITKHHIIPSSRGGTDADKNIADVQRKKHRLYHQMFSNMTPDEILADLVNNYWNGQSHWLLQVIAKDEL